MLDPRRIPPGAGIVAVIVIVVATAAAYAFWGWQSASAAAKVQVVAGPGPIRCNDGELPVGLTDEDDVPGFAIQMKAKPGAWCQVPISVRNDSSRTITVHDLTFPVTRLGSSGGPLVVTDDGSLTGPVGSKESMDAVFKLDDQIDPGDFSRYLMRIEVNPHSCQSAGLSSLPDVPRVRFSALHRDHETSGAISLQAKVSGKGLRSGCP